MLEDSNFHRKHHAISKGLKKSFSITSQKVKKIIRKCTTYSLDNKNPLPARSLPKSTQRNEIQQMDMFHFAMFRKVKDVHHTTNKGFQCATALSSEKADYVILYLLEVMVIMGIQVQIRTHNVYVTSKMEKFFSYMWRERSFCLCVTVNS